MPFYVADYLADTGHLTTLEHGAYLLLMMHYWQTEGLPTDAASLAAIVRLSGRDWQRMAPKLRALFRAGEWRHKRIDEELSKASQKGAARAEAGRRGGIAKAQQTGSRGLANATDLPKQKPKQNDDFALASSSQPQSQKESPSLRSGDAGDETGAPPDFAKPKPKAKGTRLPADWAPSPDGMNFAVEKLGSGKDGWDELAKFRDYWTGKAGASAVKLDWEATWRNWVRTAAERRAPARAGPGGRPFRTNGWLKTAEESQRDADRAASIHHEDSEYPGATIDVDPTR